MSTPEKQIDAYLEDIRKRFLEKKVTSTKGLSWGQFLDGANQGGQVGLYGTVAAAVAIKTRNNNQSPEARAVESELITYWNNRNSPLQHDNLCQNVRLAALLLGLTYCSQGHSSVVIQIVHELESRFSDFEELWGESSRPPPNAPTYCEWASSVVTIFSFQALQHYTGPVDDFGTLRNCLDRAAKALQKAYVNDSRRPRPHLLAMLAAVVLVLGRSADASVRGRLTDEISSSAGVTQRSWHYVDYLAFSDECNRDYVILPTLLFVPVLLLQSKIEGDHYLRAINVIDQIKANLDSNESRLFKDATDRPSTLEQAFAVLALDASRKKPDRSSLSLLIPRIWIFLRKKRRPEWLFAWIMIIAAYLPLGVAVSAQALLDIAGLYLHGEIQQLLQAATQLPAWVPTAVLLLLSAIRQPLEMLKAAMGRSKQG